MYSKVMEERNGLILYSLDEIKDEFLGVRGTPDREAHEQAVQASVKAYKAREERKVQRVSSHEEVEYTPLRPLTTVVGAYA